MLDRRVTYTLRILALSQERPSKLIRDFEQDDAVDEFLDFSSETSLLIFILAVRRYRKQVSLLHAK